MQDAPTGRRARRECGSGRGVSFGAKPTHTGHETFKDGLRRAVAEAASKDTRGEPASARVAKGEPAAALKDTAAATEAKQEYAEPEMIHLQAARQGRRRRATIAASAAEDLDPGSRQFSRRIAPEEQPSGD